MSKPTRIFIDRDRVAQVKAAYARGEQLNLPLFKIRRPTGLLRASSFVLRDKDGNEIARGMVDPSGKTCGATAWVEVPEGVEIEFK